MGERLLLALLSCAAGILIGLFAPGFLPAAQDMRVAERDWLADATPQPAPTPVPLVVARPSAAQTSVPPTLVPPPPPPKPTLPPTPVVHTFVVALQGGGEMRVVAVDEAAARNNVKSSGATPAD
jgi:hypothetical protein